LNNRNHTTFLHHIKGHAAIIPVPLSSLDTTYTSMPPNVNSTDIPLVSGDMQKTIVVVGLGMAAVAFMEKLVMYDTKKQYIIKVFGDEPERKIF
jgi:tellurite resistance protein TehA-like permease